MITEMAKNECKNALDDLITNIDEKAINNLINILKQARESLALKKDQDVVRNINDITFDMILKRHQCKLTQTVKSINNGLTNIEKYISTSIQSDISKSMINKKLILKVISGGKLIA